MAEANKVVQCPPISSEQFGIILAALSMLKVSSLRGLAKEMDSGIRSAREQRAHKITALEVLLSNAK